MSTPDPSDIASRNEATQMLQRLPLLRDWLEMRQEAGKTERRAFIIEFAGMPKAGKSSAIESVRHFFSHGYRVVVGAKKTFVNSPTHQYEVYTPAEGVSLRTPSYLKTNKVDFNAWAGAYGLQELIQAKHDTHNDLVILDRGPWDAGCWLEFWKGQVKCPPPESVEEMVQFFRSEHWITCSDLHVVLTIDPEEAVLREQRTRLIEHGGFSSNSEGMRHMRDIYTDRSKELKSAKSAAHDSLAAETVLLLDTTKLRPLQLANRIIRAALSLLEAQIDKHSEAADLSPSFVEEHASRYASGLLTPQGKKLPKAKQKSMLSFIPEFVNQANRLPPAQRLRLKREIQHAQKPDSLNVAARATKEEDSPLKRHLEDMLKRVRAT